MPTVFISYRRDDAAGYAGRLHEALARRFGPDVVFRDIDTLLPGQDFVGAIDDRLRDCRVFLALIGREWIDARDSSGARRIDQPHDYVRLEIAGALARPEVRVVPILIEGATMPAPGLLPADIRPLARRHAVSLRDDAWDHDVNRLTAAIGGAARGTAGGGGMSATRPAALVSAAVRRRPFLAAAALAIAVAAIWLATRTNDAVPGKPLEPPDSPTAAGGVAVTRPGNVAAARTDERETVVPPGEAGAYGLAIPAVAEIVHDSVIYTLLSASMAPLDAETSQLRLRFRFTNEGTADALAWDASFRLLANGQTFVPTSGLSEVVHGRSSTQGIVTFTVPSATGAATLRVLGLNRTAELPLALSPTGRPAGDEQANAGDELSRATIHALVTTPRLLLRTSEGSVVVERVSGRRFVNAVRLRFSIRMTNTARYARGVPTLRLTARDRTVAPLAPPFLIVQPDSDGDTEVEFEVPPDTTRAVLRVPESDAAAELPLDLP